MSQCLFQGKSISITLLEGGIAKLCFDLEGLRLNMFNRLTLSELSEAVKALQNNSAIKGLIYTSAKNVFIVGADISELAEMSEFDTSAILNELKNTHRIFKAYEDLPVPSVTAINGLALGGGLEWCLLSDYRVMADNTKIGFPEVNLGILPGYGGTVRTPRIAGVENAAAWISSCKEYAAPEALAAGMVDAVVDVALVEQTALEWLRQTLAGDTDIQSRKIAKNSALKISNDDLNKIIESAKKALSKRNANHYPAALTALNAIEKTVLLPRDEALVEETHVLTGLLQSEVSKNLIHLFFGERLLAKNTKQIAATSEPVRQAAVLGAGIMGGGIAYQSALTGTPIIMKDIAQSGIDMGMAEITGLLNGQVKRGRITPDKMTAIVNKIDATLDYSSIENADFIIEAVVENTKVKQAVLSDVESLINEDSVLTSNTSTIRIDLLASVLKRPKNFCGMHFFNPVYSMPLVEIIRGKKTSDQTIAKAVNYALAMRKKPIVVNDCPGFLVNRVLFAYLWGFSSLLKEGVSFIDIDKAAEQFGWPMGPAYLCDVIGIDTSVHAATVMAEGFPDRLAFEEKTVIEVLYAANRLGQKNGLGFYRYQTDDNGRIQKRIDEGVTDIIKDFVNAPKQLTRDEIIDRLMIPFALESIRCLEEGVAANPTDIDMAMLYGLGFPSFRGGIIRYVDNIGLPTIVQKAQQMASQGALYQPTAQLLAMAAKGENFYTKVTR